MHFLFGQHELNYEQTSYADSTLTKTMFSHITFIHIHSEAKLRLDKRQ